MTNENDRAAASAPRAELPGATQQNMELVIARLKQIASGAAADVREAAEEALPCARAVLAQAAPVAADEDFGEELAAFLADHTRLNQDGIDQTAMRIVLELNDLALRPVPAEDIQQWREEGYIGAPVAAVPDGYVLTLEERNYDQRVKAIIAFNTCTGDLDDKLAAAYRAMLAAAPAPESEE